MAITTYGNYNDTHRLVIPKSVDLCQKVGGPLEGNVKMPQAAGRCRVPGGNKPFISPPTGSETRDSSTFPTKNSSNERRKRVERRTTAADSNAAKSGRTIPMLPPPPPRIQNSHSQMTFRDTKYS